MKISPVNLIQTADLKPHEIKSDKILVPGFKDTLTDSIKKVNELQIKAQQAMQNLSTGRSENIHETMIAMQQAEIAFKMMVQVRNKIMTAYQEIMRMTV
ncbi:MAG: flagellar hook-basal body complex protein FliE [Deltaproteobacteria bacterium]|nr:flagellar hook-basal body complex protein FliE [Deltaproteobacteria bacterium]MBW2052666.1 flagellar hook-basal body complex protein FliE [Deltaproteobacteria bacterium]MBW2141353.1 flagellar hook-basal body complex protein FliE [Deltaproteobacteria bacterium]MBW2322742.1 flagellar hook-basal body complex protein FliE [Deltaproteobacteria bacterium]